jgi:hypothetical protein
LKLIDWYNFCLYCLYKIQTKIIMPVNQITIISLTIVVILLTVMTLIIISGPKKIEKYMSNIYKLREQYNLLEGYEATDDFEGYEARKRMIVRDHDKKYKKLANRIKHNLHGIVKRNKTINGDTIIHDHDEHQSGMHRLKKATIGETTQKEGTHTINKSAVYLCDIDHPDDNTLAHVLIHEYAHVINTTVGHDEPWTRLFDILQDVAHKEGWFNRHKRVELHTYCGGKYNG